jgi:hypothetical protein
MTNVEIQNALTDITSEKDPTLKHLKLASIVSKLFRERGIELVVVGGSAIEFYTEGEYVSGDVDMCLIPPSRVDLRTRQELMGVLGAKGGPRSWEVAGAYVDILGEVESLALTSLEEVAAPYGNVKLVSPEELLVERVLISVYPQAYAPAEQCARKLIAVALQGQLEMNWPEVQRLAARREYGILPEVKTLVSAVANELGKSSPCNP